MVLTSTLPTLFRLGGVVQTRLLVSVLVVVLLWLVNVLMVRLINWRITRPEVRYRGRKLSNSLLLLASLLLLSWLWLEGLASLGTFLGLAAAGLTVALREVILSIAGWLYIVLRHPFSVRDRIQVGEHKGDVIDIQMMAVSLIEIGNWVDADQSTGRIIHLPTSRVFTEPVINYTRDFHYIWHELAVTITFESNWEKAKGILLEPVLKL